MGCDPEPNPGSKEALERGCACPIEDNAHGRGAWGSDGTLFWTSISCPMHGRLRESATRADDNLVELFVAYLYYKKCYFRVPGRVYALTS